MDRLKEQALKNKRHRVRVCLHKDPTEQLQEMLIVLTDEVYIRPHKHLARSESIHVLEGQVDVVFFDEKGTITDVFSMGDYSSGNVFIYRIDTSVYHTLVVRSELLIFKESTSGPFDRSKSMFADWSPAEEDIAASHDFSAKLSKQLAEWKK